MIRSLYKRITFFGCLKALGIAAGLTCAAALGTASQAIEAEAAVSASWSGVSLSSDGDARWDLQLSSGYTVDTYEIKLARQKDGVWNESYKTYKTSDEGYSISFSTKGRYYFKVRAKLIGGEYTEWSAASNTVDVTSDDLNSDSSSGVDYYYYYYGNYGPGGTSDYTYYGPAGPGTSYSNTSVINTVTGQVKYSNSYYSSDSTVTQSSGWRKTANGYMYIYANGTYKSNGWDLIDGSWYYFDANGIMKTGWLYLNDKWYFCLTSGKMAVSSWNYINGSWYYFNESGIMQTGYIVIDGKTYYTDSSGARVESAYNPDGHLFDLNGVMVE